MAEKTERPKAWPDVRKQMRHRWATPFRWLEWLCEWLAYFLSQWAVVDILQYAAKFTIVATVVAYFVTAHAHRLQEAREDLRRFEELQRQTQQQRRANHYQAWQMLNSAAGKRGDAGRGQALLDLYADGVTFMRIDLEGAVLSGIQLYTNGRACFQNANLKSCQLDDAHLNANFFRANLDHARLDRAILTNTCFTSANLMEASLIQAHLDGAIFTNASLKNANFRNANLTNAKLVKADLEGVIFEEAILCGVNLSAVENWRKIRSLRAANIYGIVNPPEGFLQWAREQGAKAMP
jgi:uncharacterized protein YjbI with pentapeptide repeats